MVPLNHTSKCKFFILAFIFLIVANLESATSQVLDPFTGATPSFKSAPEKGTTYNSGDWGVSDQNGAVTYSVPIDVPSGRNGMAPSLILRYSSNLPLRGGLAAGWKFDQPSVEVDSTLGASEGLQYKISLGSVSGRLIEVPDASPYPQSTTYRVQFDNSNTRIFLIDAVHPGRSTAKWVALTPDGIRHYFEQVDGANGKGIWYIIRQEDSFGNSILYSWKPIIKETIYLGQSLAKIEYSENVDANLKPYAKIEFDYAPLMYCEESDIPIGAAYRRGNKQVTGAQKLNAIKVLVRNTQTSNWSLRKQVDLSYKQNNSILYENPPVKPFPPDDGAMESPQGELEIEAFENEGVAQFMTPQDSIDPEREAPENEGITTSNETPWETVFCVQNPIRYLTQIDIKAFDISGNATVLPPINFDYNGRRNLSLSLSPIPSENPMREVTVEVPGFGQEGTNAPHLGGLKATLLDINSDGIKDRVSVIEEDRVCTLVWNKGMNSGSFEEEDLKSPLPTADWFDEWRGNSEVILDDKEGCTLSGQVAYRSVTVFQGDGTPGRHVLAPGHMNYHFMDFTGDGKLDLITNVWATSQCFESYDPLATSPVHEPDCSFGLDQEIESGFPPPLKAEKDRGRFLWRVYPGTGNPDQPFRNQFSIKVRSPVNLPPPAASEAALDLSTKIHYSVPTLFDIDGDGFLDAIDTKPTTLGSCPDNILLKNGCDWKVYFGDGTGTFPEDDARIWKVPKATLDSDYWEKKSCDEDFFLRRSTVIGLKDIDGDGLADLVVRRADRQLYSYRNTGSGFDSLENPLNGNTALEQVQTECEGFVLGGTLRNGNQGYQRRLIDLDADGLLDMIWFEGGSSITETSSVKAKFNLGGRFGEPVTLLYPEKWGLSKRILTAEWESEDFVGNWYIVNDFTDVNGDGLADLVKWHAPGEGSTSPTMTYVTSPGLPAAPDLLSRVTNGRGKVLNFFYKPSSNPEVVQWGGSGSTMPTPRWVVSKSVVEGGFETPATTTHYFYEQPNYNSMAVHTDFKERSQFAGFSQNIQTSNYSNGTSKQIRKMYDYEGLHADLISSKTFLDGQLHRVVRMDWLHESLFGDRINQSLPVLTETCTASDSGMSETECFATAEHVRYVEQSWRFNPNARQFLNVQRLEMLGETEQTGDRRSNYDYDIRYSPPVDPEDYRIRIREKRDGVRNIGNNFVETGHEITHFNNSTGLPDQIQSHLNDSDVATTNFAYDPETGNLLSIQKPEQVVELGPSTTYSYDSHELFVSETLNELGHRTMTTYDVPTGVLIKREGPNFVMAGSQPVYDTERWKVDGLGRVLSHSVSIDMEVNGTPGYEERVVELFTYNDLNFHESRTSVSIQEEHLLDFNDTHWIQTVKDFDGRGRLLSSRELIDGDTVTQLSYSYSDHGSPNIVEMINPSNNDERIKFTYEYDGLGRVTQFTRPDSTGTTNTYSGFDQTITDVTSDGTGRSATKRFDVLGHLVELHEHNSGGSTAITRYLYDANDNLKQITDAEENITRLTHDWLGNRLSVIRGEREWQYRYDLNGNLISKQSPHPSNEDANQYTTRFTYDDLDRVLTKRFINMRFSSPPPSSSFNSSFDENEVDQAMSEIQYLYDSGHNSIGRLSRVNLPIGEVKYNYDSRGFLRREQRNLTLTQPFSLSDSLEVRRTYNALGQLTRSQWQDGQQWRIRYDERALVDTVEWFDPQDQQWSAVADYERNLAGLPVSRENAYGQTRRYTYDVLSRPLTDELKLDDQSEALMERSYQYSDTGNLVDVVGQTNGVSADAHYEYDVHDRLISATGPNDYQGQFTYSATGNVLSANVSWENATHSRNVDYSYGQRDPQVVDILTDAVTDEIYAAYVYDDVGNMTWRDTPDGESLLHWDGEDRIRRVETANDIETYYYDHNGQRMLAVTQDQGARFWFGERETHFSLDGTETRNYLHLSAGGPNLARIENGTSVELQYANALQNLMVSLDMAGTVKASFLYGPFGEVVFETGGEDHRRQFNGKENDAISGLRYYGFRYYDPITLRWNSADPLYSFLPDLGLGEPLRMNLYAFSLNNPLRYYDPDGRDIRRRARWEDKMNLPAQGNCRNDPGGCELEREMARHDKWVAGQVAQRAASSTDKSPSARREGIVSLRPVFKNEGTKEREKDSGCVPFVDCDFLPSAMPGPGEIAVIETVVDLIKPNDDSILQATKAAVLSIPGAVVISGGVLVFRFCEGSMVCPITRSIINLSSNPAEKTLLIPESFDSAPREANIRVHPKEDPIVQEDQ